ncbi:MAG TPA: ABC transporter permease [Fulvivirga sp.]|nr:ABC transporter permease [Fulvivirga sp.]
MLQNYFKVAFRNILKDKFYSLINVFGLAVGISSCIFILIYINDEFSYDRFNTKADRIYRLTEFIEQEGSGERSSSVPFPVGTTLLEDYGSLIENQVRFFNFQSPTILVSEEQSEKEFNETGVYFADSTFFDVFDYEVVKGDKNTALDKPNSIMITERAAKKYFGDQDPIGQFLKIQNQVQLLVTAVMADPPTNAHIDFDFIISFSTMRAFFNGQYPDNWYWNPCWTYIVLKNDVAPETLSAEFPAFIQKYFPAFVKDDIRMELQPLTAIHLTSNLEFELKSNSSEENIYAFILIGMFILFIATMNFMNLSTARSAKRAKEVGLRKTLGSAKGQLVFQFLMESLIISFIGILIALLFTVVGLPAFNVIADKSIGYDIFMHPTILIGLLSIFVVVGIGSGIYPALVLSSFVPIKVLKDSQVKGGRGAVLRKGLVIIQFSLSIIMIIGTVIAINQLDFLRKSGTGFNKDQILYISALNTPMTRNYEAFKKQVELQPDVYSVTGVLDVLGAHHQGQNVRFEGMEKSKLFSIFWVNHDFFKTFDLEIVQGRAFKENILSDDTTTLVVNEALARQMGWTLEETIGKKFEINNNSGEIIGVVKDFNFVSKHREIEPLVIQQRSPSFHFNFSLKYVAIRLNSKDISNTLSDIETKWKVAAPGFPFDYFFLDQELNKLYKDEEKLANVANIFSVLAVIVACLGLFALASFMAEERKKEIGIRKVMGASATQIVLLLSMDFTKLVLVAFVIACPIAYYVITSWLNNFAFHVDINWLIFLFVGVVTLVIALLTIMYRALESAFSNPVKVMRHQ